MVVVALKVVVVVSKVAVEVVLKLPSLPVVQQNPQRRTAVAGEKLRLFHLAKSLVDAVRAAGPGVKSLEVSTWDVISNNIYD